MTPRGKPIRATPDPYVTWQDLGEVLDENADKIVERLRPEFKGIDRQLQAARRHRQANDREISAIKLECVKRQALCAKAQKANGTSKAPDPVGDIQDKAKVILAIVAAAVMVTAALVTGIIYLVKCFPW